MDEVEMFPSKIEMLPGSFLTEVCCFEGKKDNNAK